MTFPLHTNAALAVEQWGDEAIIRGNLFPSILWLLLGFGVLAGGGYIAAKLLGQVLPVPSWAWPAWAGVWAINALFMFAVQLHARRNPFAVARRDTIELPRRSLVLVRPRVAGGAALRITRKTSEHSGKIQELLLIERSEDHTPILAHIIVSTSMLRSGRLLQKWCAASGIAYLGEFKFSEEWETRPASAREMLLEQLRLSAPSPLGGEVGRVFETG